MKCADIEKYMLDYLDNNLSDELKVQIELHCRTCGDCSNKVMQFKELFIKINGVKTAIDPSPELETVFLNNLEKEKNIEMNKQRSNTNFRTLFRIAAAFILFLGGTFFGLVIQNQIMNNSKLTKLEHEVSQLKQQVHMTA